MSEIKCKCGEDINYAINNGKCDSCIEGYIENLECDNAQLKQALGMADAAVALSLEDITGLKAHIKLHAGDCLSLSNESDMFRERCEDADNEVTALLSTMVDLKAELATHQWIRPEDRMPETDALVLCVIQHWNTKGILCVALFKVDESDVSWRTADDNSELSHDYDVIKWQPITLPTEKGE